MASQATLSSSFGGVDSIEPMSELTCERTARLYPGVDAALDVTGGR